jgi:hypothetical protein
MMFWTATTSNGTSYIGSAYMDGTNMNKIVTTNINDGKVCIGHKCRELLQYPKQVIFNVQRAWLSSNTLQSL